MKVRVEKQGIYIYLDLSLESLIGVLGLVPDQDAKHHLD